MPLCTCCLISSQNTRSFCFEIWFLRAADSGNSQYFIKEQIRQEEGAELLSFADVLLGSLHMMQNDRQKRTHRTFRVFWLYNSETEKTQINVVTPSLGAEREVG